MFLWGFADMMLRFGRSRFWLFGKFKGLAWSNFGLLPFPCLDFLTFKFLWLPLCSPASLLYLLISYSAPSSPSEDTMPDNWFSWYSTIPCWPSVPNEYRIYCKLLCGDPMLSIWSPTATSPVSLSLFKVMIFGFWFWWLSSTLTSSLSTVPVFDYWLRISAWFLLEWSVSLMYNYDFMSLPSSMG